MHLHDDFKQRAIMHGDKLEWIASPMKGVDRRMLERMGGEVARATTIVRYAPGSAFSAHTHTGGEEFIVLDGVFQDEHGDYPAGSYIRNPPTSSHTPGSEEGCVILVKLWQYDPEDRSHVIIDLNKMEAIEDTHRSGVSVTPLFKDNRETVRLEHWAGGSDITLGAEGGAEYFVLNGSFLSEGEDFQKNSWLRLPEGDQVIARVGAEGARIWVKTDHLPFAKAP